jgi:hypothetical protein
MELVDMVLTHNGGGKDGKAARRQEVEEVRR